jgi:hypothetical protein
VPPTDFSNTRKGRNAFTIKPKQVSKSSNAGRLKLGDKATLNEPNCNSPGNPDRRSAQMIIHEKTETGKVFKSQSHVLGDETLGKRATRDTSHTLDKGYGHMNASLPIEILPRLLNETGFGRVWETEVLPLLDRELPRLIGHSELTINVLRALDSPTSGKSKSTPSDSHIRRVIHVSCPFGIDVSYQETIRNMTKETLAEFRAATVCEFHVGKVRRCCQYCGTSEEDPDKSCPPKRVHYQLRPVMGASIGLDKSTFVGTLGGYLLINGNWYVWMTNGHVLECETRSGDNRRGEFSEVVNQPAKGDSMDAAQSNEFGDMQYMSTNDKTRISTLPGADGKPARCGMDWAIVSATSRRAGTNIMIMDDDVPEAIESETFNEEDQQVRTISPSTISCGDICEPREGMVVHTVGRTSGYNVARITEGRSSVHFGNDDIRKEWGLEILNPSQEDGGEHKRWILSGPGQPGDSGAWVVSKETNQVCGMIFARGPVFGERQRVAYFSSMNDIILDIKETVAKWNKGIKPDDIEIQVVKPRIVPHSSIAKRITNEVRTADALTQRQIVDLTGLIQQRDPRPTGTVPEVRRAPQNSDGPHAQRSGRLSAPEVDKSHDGNKSKDSQKDETPPTFIRRARAVAMNYIALTSDVSSSTRWMVSVM